MNPLPARLVVVLLAAALVLNGCAADPELDVSPATLDFGASESVLPLTVRNAADDSGVFRSGIEELRYEISQDRGWVACTPNSGTVGAGSEEVTVRIFRDYLSPGPNQATLRVESNGGHASVVVLAMSEVPICLVNPQELDFGWLELFQSRDLIFTIANLGGGLLAGEVGESCLHFQIVGENQYSLSAGETQEFTVRFTPTSSGVKTCRLRVGSPHCAEVHCTGFSP